MNAWKRGSFERCHTDQHGNREVIDIAQGWVRDCWGINIPRQPHEQRHLTFVPTGQKATLRRIGQRRLYAYSLAELKAYAAHLEQICPKLTRCKTVAELIALPQDERDAYVDAAFAFKTGELKLP